jgi:glycosyltransferase involved in cell wall biosynthesis
MPLRIAAKVPRTERGYFKEQIEPLVDGKQTQVNERSKESFLANAIALLFPIDWPEPFGLVMIEAMACGTPVIAFRRGSVPEVIEDGATGFVVENDAEALEAIKRVAELTASECVPGSSGALARAGWQKVMSTTTKCLRVRYRARSRKQVSV